MTPSLATGMTSGTTGTIQASDQINGGDGNDTLKLYSYGGGGSDLLPVTVKNVETFQFLAPGNKNIDVSANTLNTLAVTQADKLGWRNPHDGCHHQSGAEHRGQGCRAHYLGGWCGHQRQSGA